jgi:RHS repeat-associated protein
VISSEGYVYDNAGNLSSKTVDSITTSYTYDAVDQLLSKSRTGYSCSYTYDGNGNRLTKTLNNDTESYSYDDGDKLTGTTWTGGYKSFTYDTAGRTTAITTAAGTTSLAYDYESRVTQITYPNQSTNTFTYNGLDTRVGKVDSGGTKTFKRDGVGVTAPVLSDGVSSFTPGISTRTSGASKFLHDDRLGTLGLETDANQATTATKAYDAFGMPISLTGSSASPFGFAGGYGYQEDSDSGLKLLGHRYYDPSTGRFLTRDPIKDGRNWYGYCDNNPQKWVDGSGLEPGKDYDTADEAARAAGNEFGPLSEQDGKERAGRIYRKKNGKFSYTYNPPVEDPEHPSSIRSYPGPWPDDCTDEDKIGDWHTHGKDGGLGGEDFSGTVNYKDSDLEGYDKLAERYGKYVGYLVAYDGTVHKYVQYRGGKPGKGKMGNAGSWRYIYPKRKQKAPTRNAPPGRWGR